MLVAASRDRDPVLATAAARALLERVEHASIDVVSAAVAQALVHPLATVRTLALETALRRAVPIAVAALRSATFDDARSIRELARHELEAALGDGSSLVRRAAMQYANLYLGRGFVRRVREAARARPARPPADRR